MTQENKAFLIEIGEKHHKRNIAKVEPWLLTLHTLQTSYRKMVEDAVGKAHDPSIRNALTDIRTAAGEHETAVGQLRDAFGGSARTGLGARAGTLLSKVREGAAQIEGLAAGASGPGWRSLRGLVLANLDSMSGFAVAQQLGLALGNPTVVDIAYPVVAAKSEHHLLLQEFLLDMATNTLLYDRDL